MEIPNLRLHRAMEHITEFEREADAFLKTNPFGITTEPYTQDGKKCLALRFKINHEPPKRLGIIAGECVHQLRAILDNLIWSLGELYPPVHPKIAFPLYLSLTDYQSAINQPHLKGIQNFPPTAQMLIEGLQPYKGMFSSAPEINPIYVLHRLWNDDKHRSPDLMGGMNSGVALKIFKLEQPATLSAGLAIHDGTKFACGVIPEGGIKPDAHVVLSTYIAFDLDGPAKGQPAVSFLTNLHSVIRDKVIANFEPLFPKA